MLLDHGADVNTFVRELGTAISTACSGVFPAIRRNYQNTSSRRFNWPRVEKHNTDAVAIVELLLENGASANLRDEAAVLSPL